MSMYELALLGSPTTEERNNLVSTIVEMVKDFGLEVGLDVLIHDSTSILKRDKRVAFAALYFGSKPYADQQIAEELLKSSAIVIPTVPEGCSFSELIPPALSETNGIIRRKSDNLLTECAAVLLECVGLLRKQRRVFVSYRRTESRTAAIQLHDILSSRGFDVFLDTHDIRPGEPFQEVLWHRLCDSDVLIMLDTPTYFESKWTRQELGRARAKEIHVLRIVWPEHTPSRLTDLSETIYLEKNELLSADGPIVEKTLDAIVAATEKLRSRSIAARYMSIVGKLRAEAEKIDASIEGIGAHRAISVKLTNGTKVWAYPVVGIPTAELLNDVADKAENVEEHEIAALVYDHVGIRDQWVAHLKWLETNITGVRWLRILEAGWVMAAWGEDKS